MQLPKVIIAHPTKQHSHQTAYALQEEGILKRYYTVFWYNKSFFKKTEKFLPGSLVKSLKKRNSELIDVSLVKMNYRLFTLEFLLRTLSGNNSNYVYRINTIFDGYISGELNFTDFDIFIGYESAALKSFRVCKEKKKICILDLAAEHYKKQKEIYLKINYFPRDTNVIDLTENIKEQELELADYIFTPSEYSKESLIQGGVPERKIIKIPYGVNLSLFEQKKTYRKEGKFKILYVGAIIVRKGIRYLLESCRRAGIANSELILIGSMGDGKEILKEYAGLYKYIPFVSQEELKNYYQDADIFVFPSLLDSFAMVVLEAMACGTPVIVSENTGAKDAVKDGVNGFIVPIMNVEKLTDKILYFYKNRDKLEEMGKNARAQAERYPWEKYRSRIRETIKKIWAERMQ